MGSSHFWATVGLWQSRAWARMGLIWDRMGSDGLGCWCIISSEQWKCYWIMNRRSVCNSAETHMANNSEVGERSCCSLDEFLRKDAGVEVATDEDGFKGVWFEARIVDPPRNLQSDLKQDRLAVVEFQTLLSEDGFSLLVENADANFIRPSPPQETAKKPLKVNDLVDAFYLDGWWTGVVAEVKENGRYLVTFEDPPDAVEFGRANLRIHWDWIGGMWIRSKNSLHKQVSENQKQRRRWIEETTSTSRRKRGRPRKAITDENTKSCKRAASSPVGEKTNRIGEKIMPEPEAISRHYTAPHVIENRSLPFAKTSTIWHAVDSMEAFNKFPQKPHFAPLHDLKEDHREGLAIAHMVTFSTITEKALGLHCSDPESSFLECLAALNDLGRHGFDIKPVEFHIKKMLSVKDQQERFREKARNVEKRIKELSECNEEIDKEIMEVGEKLKSLESKRRKNKMKVEMLRKSVEGMKKLIELC